VRLQGGRLVAHIHANHALTPTALI